MNTNNATLKTTHQFTLDNGLRVVVRQDDRKPEFCSTVTYGVGNYYENPAEKELSAIVTSSLFDNNVLKALKDMGGKLQTSMGNDSHIQQIKLPRDHLETAFKTHSAMMLKEVEDEIFQHHLEGAILRSKKSSTFVSAISFSPELNALIETGTRYYTVPEGLTNSLEQLTLDQIKHWRKTWYVPSNAVLVVTGDITLNEVKQLAEEYFGRIAKAEAPHRELPQTAPAPAYRQLTQQRDTKYPLMLVVFNVPSIATATDVQTARALQVMTALLTKAAPKRLITPTLNPANIYANYPAFMRGDSRLSFAFYFDGDAHTAEASFWAWLEEVKHTLFTPEEIEPAIKNVSIGVQERDDSLEGQSRIAGLLLTNGCPLQLLDLERSQLENVTPAEIQSTAKTWLTRERATVGHVYPLDK